MIAGSSSIFFLIHMKYVVFMCCTIKILIANWPRTWKFSCYRQGRQLLLFFLTMVTRWSRSTPNFYALIDQNLAAEFLRKTYAASWNLFALTAEADIVLCQLVMFLTVFFHWMFTAFRCLIYPNTLRYLPHRFSANRRLKINKIRRHKDLSAPDISKQFSSSTHLSNFDQSEHKNWT